MLLTKYFIKGKVENPFNYLEKHFIKKLDKNDKKKRKRFKNCPQKFDSQ